MPEPHNPEYTVDMEKVISLIQRIDDKVDTLDGATRQTEGNNKDKMRTNAEVGRELTHLAHLCDTLRLAVLDEFYAFKGQQ